LDVGYITSFLSKISLPTVACRHFQPRPPNGIDPTIKSLCEHPQSSILFLVMGFFDWSIIKKCDKGIRPKTLNQPTLVLGLK
jgi:hypothetical protein